MRTVKREYVPYEVEDDCGMCFNVERASNGILTALVRACGRVTIDGQVYEYDKDIRVRLTKAKG